MGRAAGGNGIRFSSGVARSPVSTRKWSKEAASKARSTRPMVGRRSMEYLSALGGSWAKNSPVVREPTPAANTCSRACPPENTKSNSCLQDLDLQRQYYDHKANWWEADPVSVSLGAVTPGIDAYLLAAAGIEGQVRLARDGSPLTEVEVCAWSTDPEGTVRCTSPGNDGRYAIGGLPGDTYKVEFWPYDEDLPIQYWNHKASWEAADPLSLSGGTVATGIDADLGSPPAPPAVTPPPLVAPPAVTKPQPHRKRCKRGFRKKRVHGKVRCVKRKKGKHQHRRHAHMRPGVPTRDAFRPGR